MKNSLAIQRRLAIAIESLRISSKTIQDYLVEEYSSTKPNKSLCTIVSLLQDMADWMESDILGAIEENEKND